MKPIKNLPEVVGKTIKNANFYSADEAICLIFDDGTYLAIEPKSRYESIEIEIDEITNEHDLFEAGLIDEEEYDRLKAEIRRLFGLTDPGIKTWVNFPGIKMPCFNAAKF